MTITRTLTLAIAAGATLLASGCSARVAEFSVVSTKNVEISRIDMKKAAIARDVVGESREYTILFVPTGTPSLQVAIDDALRRGGGDLMTSTKIDAGGWYIPLLFGTSYIKASGDVVSSTGAGSADIKKGE